jgi:hypothetical protein
MVNYTRVKGKYRDLVKVLSTFTFDKKELLGNPDKEGLY